MRDKEKRRAWYKAYREKNRDRLNANARKWQMENRERVRGYYHANKEKYKPIYKAWKDANRAKTSEYAKKIYRERYGKDVQYRLRFLLRRHAQRIKYYVGKGAYTLRHLGCTVAEARAHIEAQWADGMSWDNHSRTGWHIDHIIPLAKFDLTDPAQVAKALHYTNLRPLWANENLSGGAAIAKERRRLK